MKKIFSLLAAVLFAGSLLADVGEVFYTFVPQKVGSGNVSDYSKSGDQEVDGLTWTVPGNWYATGSLRLGGKSLDAVDRSIIGKSTIGDAIAKIVITHAGINSTDLVLNTVKLTVASDAAFSEGVVTKTLTLGTDYTVEKDKAGTIEFTPAGDFWAKDSYYKFDFNFTNSNSSNRAFTLNKIEFYSYEAAGTPSVSADVDEIDFGTVEQGEGEGYLNKTFKLTGKNLTAGVRLNPLGAIFSVDPVVINPDGDGKIDATITVIAQTGWTGVQDNVINVTSEKDPEEFDLFKLMDLKMNVIAPLPTIKVNGSWDWDAPVTLVAAGDKKTASATHTFATAQTVEFGILVGENWKSNGGEVTVTRANNSVALTGYTGNMNLVIDQAGEYTFTWEYETNTITVAYPEIVIDPTKHDTLFAYNGKGTTNAEAVIFQGGTLTPFGYGGSNNNMMYNSSQKGNMTIKIGKGYHKDAAGEGYYFMAVTLDEALKEGDLIQVAAFRTGNTDCVFGMDFNAAADSATATTDCQVLFPNSLQVLASNGVPSDTVFVVPAAAAGAKYIRLYRNSGSTGLYIANFSVYREKSVEPAHTYTVAGSPTTVFGTSWDAANTDNDMIKDGDIYKWEKTDLTLSAGDVEFKVCVDHAWTPSYPASNYKLNIPEAAVYTVTITFNPDGNVIAAEATKTGEAGVIRPTIVLHGDFGSGWADSEEFVWDGEKANATLSLNLEVGTYEFGMKFDGTWKANGATLTFTAPSTNLAEGSGNMHIEAIKAGLYVFTYTYETQVLTVTFPTGTGIEETIAEGKAVKVVRNGQVLILKGDKTFNVIGQIVK